MQQQLLGNKWPKDQQYTPPKQHQQCRHARALPTDPVAVPVLLCRPPCMPPRGLFNPNLVVNLQDAPLPLLLSHSIKLRGGGQKNQRDPAHELPQVKKVVTWSQQLGMKQEDIDREGSLWVAKRVLTFLSNLHKGSCTAHAWVSSQPGKEDEVPQNLLIFQHPPYTTTAKGEQLEVCMYLDKHKSQATGIIYFYPRPSPCPRAGHQAAGGQPRG